VSIVTKRGDDGYSDLLFGKRISKTDPRLEAVGTLDELNAALGLARAAAPNSSADAIIDRLQEKLVGLMGELAVLPEDSERYAASDYPSICGQDVISLETEARSLEEEGLSFKGWARPGANGNVAGAQLDFARAVCRRAERRVLSLAGGVPNPAISLFLNRASDLLWLLARKTEQG